MSDPVATVEATIDPYLELQAWIRGTCSLGDQVRDEAYRCGISAVVHRLIKWGWDESINYLNARDCLTACLMCGGEFAEMFLRAAFTRAIIEDDREVLQKLQTTPFIPQSRFWLAKLAQGVRGESVEALMDCAKWMQEMQGEELMLASILIARSRPDLADIGWLEKADEVPPRTAAALCLELVKRPEWQKVVKDWVRARPAVRYSVEDERWEM